MNKFKNKKTLTMTFVIAIIISLVTLIVLFSFISSEFKDYEYSESILNCNLFFSNINGKPVYFTGSLNETTLKLTSEIARQCPSKDIIINDKQISKAAELIQDCWKKAASGKDIFGSNVKNQKICLYCGKITAKSDINDFRGKLNKELQKSKYSSLYSTETEIQNFNNNTLQLVPQNIEEGKSTILFYYMYRTDIPKNLDFSNFVRDEYISPISKMTGNVGSAFTIGNFMMSNNVLKTYGNVILSKQIENKNQDDFKKFTNTIDTDCTIIVPEKNFN